MKLVLYVMQNTALSLYEHSGHCGATSSYDWSWIITLSTGCSQGSKATWQTSGPGRPPTMTKALYGHPQDGQGHIRQHPPSQARQHCQGLVKIKLYERPGTNHKKWNLKTSFMCSRPSCQEGSSSRASSTGTSALGMQNTALCFTERSGHFGATSSDHWSWHPIGDKWRG